MIKFPFSKKAINIIIATALVVTPLATFAPVGGNVATVAANEVTASSIENLLKLKTYYNGLTDQQKLTINDHRGLLSGLETEWAAILGTDLEAKITTNLTAGKTAPELMTDIAKVFLQSTYDDVYNEVGLFDTKYSADFDQAFGISFIQFLGFYADLMENIKANYNQSTIEAAIETSLADFMVAEAKKVSSYSSLSASVQAKLGAEYDVASLVGMKFEMMAVLSDNGGTYAPGTLQNTLIAALKQTLSLPGVVDAGNSVTTETVTAANGIKTVVATVDVTTLTQLLASADSVEKVTFTVDNLLGEKAEVRIPAAAFSAIAAENPDAIVEFQSSEGIIAIPVKEINLTMISQSLGVNADDVTVNILLGTVSIAVQAHGAVKLKSPVVEFKITATAGAKTVSLNRFNSYIERQITATTDLNADRATVVRLNADGSIGKAVPTVTNGSEATFKSMSNSLYTVIENEVTFKDIQTNWAKATIETLASKMIINGMPSGNFEPLKIATRAEFAALLTRSLGLNNDIAYDNRFKDVKGGEWYVADMMAAVEVGILEGHANGTFKGNDSVTREQAAVMIARAIMLTNVDVELDSQKSLNDFVDKATVSTWATSSVEKLIQAEIITGRPNAKIAPKSGSQRAEVSVMLERFLKSVYFMN